MSGGVIGMILVIEVSVSILLYSKASHCFISIMFLFYHYIIM